MSVVSNELINQQMRRAFLGLLGTLGTFPNLAIAWGGLGHEMTALVAESLLSPTAAHELKDILPSGSTLGSVASWADEIRDEKGWAWSAALHFVSPPQNNDVELCGNGESFFESGCAKRGCIITAIWNYSSILAGFSATKQNSTRQEKEEAVKFLVHFLGDTHQPLHTTGRYNGGNGINVMFDKQTTNQNGKLSLHKVWDGQMLNKMVGSGSTNKQKFVKQLLQMQSNLTATQSSAISSCTAPIKLPDGKTLPRTCPLDWASFSNAVTCNPSLVVWDPVEYQQTQDLGTNGYSKRMETTLSQQILVAGMRLSNLLNDVLDPQPSEPAVPTSSAHRLLPFISFALLIF